MISDYLTEAADFFEANPKSYTNDYLALRNGIRCGYNDPDADQWDIIGRLGSFYHRDHPRQHIPLWMFRRMTEAFRIANEMELQPQESTFITYMMHYSDSVLDVIAALRRAAKYMVEHNMNEPLDLTPPPPPIPPRKGSFSL